MTILGVDPGIASTGFGVISTGDGEEVTLLDSGVITTEPKTPQDSRLRIIYERIFEIITRHKPDAVALEAIFFSRNLKALVEVSEAIGVITLAAGNHGISVTKFTPLEVKASITGFGKAGKQQVHHMVSTILNSGDSLKGDGASKRPGASKGHHTSDALAVAICYRNLHC